MSLEELLNAPSLEGQFPLRFRNGFSITTLGFWCLSCNTAIPLKAVHGHVSRMLERVVDVTAAACCSCGQTSSYRIRLRDDATCSYQKGGTWVTEKVGRKRVSLLNRLRLQLLCLSIRWKCYRLSRTVKKMQKNMQRRANKGW